MKRLFKNILIVSFSFLLSLVLAEVGLRLLGDTPGPQPVRYEPEKFSAKEPFVSDIITGWSLKPGRYSIRQEGREEPVRINIDLDGSRITSYAPIPANNHIRLVGDSYIFGHGLHDYETLGWQLQAGLNNVRVFNHGVGGYGTCQVLLNLLKIAHHIKPGTKVIYGLSSFHAQRSIADPRLDYWIAMTSPDHSSHYPRCQLKQSKPETQSLKLDSQDEVEFLKPRIWNPLLPLTGQLVLSRRITDAYLSLATESQESQRAITITIIRVIDNLVKEKDSELVVLLQDLTAVDLAYYQGELAKLKVMVVDGSEEGKEASQRLTDGHPGPEMNKAWAGMVAKLVD